MKKSKINRLAVISLQLAVLGLFLVGGQACLYADQMPEEVIGSNYDDGQESNVTVCAVVLTYVSMRYTSADSFTFVRFTSIPIAKDATIDACTLLVDVISASFDDPDIDIYCEDIASAPTLVAENECISPRTPTTAVVEWIASDLGTGYTASPELKTLVQEIVNRGDWSSGNDLAFIIVVNPASSFAFDAYESSGNPAKLHIWYSTGEPPEIDKPRKNIMSGGIIR